VFMPYRMNDSRIAQGPSLVSEMARYEVVLDWIFQQAHPVRILDFGSGPIGLGSVYAGPYAGIDVTPIVPQVPNLHPIVGVHPFDLRVTVDLFCAIDVLEHIPPDARDRLFEVARRVGQRAVIVSYPTAASGRAFDIESLALFGGCPPAWLVEHLAQPHPDTEWVARAIDRHGFRVVAYYRSTPRWPSSTDIQ